jgi:tetrahydromethanopterin S-methyltransferase subunit G
MYNRATSKFDDIHKKVEMVNRKLDHIKNEVMGKIKKPERKL